MEEPPSIVVLLPPKVRFPPVPERPLLPPEGGDKAEGAPLRPGLGLRAPDEGEADGRRRKGGI